MAAVRRLTTSALFFAALAVATTACGVSGGGAHPPAASLSPTAVADPLAGWSAQRIEKQSATDTLAARYVRITGTGTDSGQQVAFDLTMVVGVGCRGTISEHGTGSFLLISKGKTVWIQPDAAFWKQEAGQHPSTSQQLLEQLFAGKYLEDTVGTGLGSLASMCSLRSLFGSSALSAPSTPLKKAGTAVIDGQRELKLTSTDAKQPGYAYVSDTAKPEILQMTVPGQGGGSLSFTYYATAHAITPPPASETIDGSKYGF